MSKARKRIVEETPKPPQPEGPALDGTVFVVDDDDAVRESIEFLMDSSSLPVKAFASAEEFLKAMEPGWRGCLLLDVRMPGMSGLQLQGVLNERLFKLPVIILTGHADVPMAVRAMQGGAFDFIEKPCREEVLLSRVRAALQKDAADQEEVVSLGDLSSRYQTLSPREQEVMALVVEGHLNKQIGQMLGISMKTIEVHRGRVMKKMEAQSLADLVRMSIRLNGGS
ncbi:MAG: response regulator [Planctomycetes bacterium]|nr:response regulator [Planctomycetota bacterium]